MAEFQNDVLDQMVRPVELNESGLDLDLDTLFRASPTMSAQQ